MHRITGLLVLILSVSFSSSVGAQTQQQARALGFSPESVYSTTDVDTVNLFNGNLILTIPIGQSYPVSERLAYNLSLVYNSSAWSYVPFLFDDVEYQSGMPEPSANAGLGWTLSLGRLAPPGSPFDLDPVNDQDRWKLIEADGSTHYFFDELHPDELDDPAFSYTRDSSYLRMVEVSGSQREVHYPDGTIYTFEPAPAGLDTRYWEVTSISDPFGNLVTIDRTLPLAWTITDSATGVARTHTIHLQDFSATSPMLGGPHVTSIELAAFDGVDATYTFAYQEIFVERGCQDNVPPAPGYDETIKLPLLTRIGLPSGEEYEMVHPGPPETAAYETSCGGLPQGPSGRVSHLVLPTGGRVEWDYDGYFIPKVDTGPMSLAYAIEAGVVERRKYPAHDHATPEATWVYDNGPVPDSGYCSTCVPPVYPNETRTVVVQPSVDGQPGSCTLHYFSAEPIDLTWLWGWGLPFSQTEEDGSGRFQSTEVWTSNAPDTTNTRRDVRCSGTQLRTLWRAYDKDPRDTSISNADSNRNQRLTLDRTVYEDDEASPGVARFAEIAYSNFDGLGHYRQAVTDGNFPGANVKTTVTNFNPDRGTYDPDDSDPGNPHTYLPWSEAERWILGTFNASSTSQGAATTHLEYCFDWDANDEYPVTPHLKRLRRLRNTSTMPSRSTDDVLEVFGTTGGNVDRERYYGADTQAIGTDDLCTLAVPAAPTYRIDKEFESGALKRQFYFANGAEVFNTYDVTLDEATALPAISADTAGLTTAYVYDELSRLTSQDPAEEAATTYTYTPAQNPGTAGFGPAKVHIERDDIASGAHVESEFLYDGFGRVAVERRLNADEATFAERATTYNARGWKLSVSEWGTPAAQTLFGDYDPFGRPGTITPPDDPAHATTLSYTGVSRVERTVMIAQGGGEGPVTTAETYDRFGRLHEVEEPVGSPTLFTYAYDEADRLVAVTAGPAGGPAVQTRGFNYDGRGFLESELHPEKGTDGTNGLVTYDGYDARGHAGEMSDLGRTLTYDFDAAERLRSVTSSATGSVKEFTYDGATTHGLGKLHEAVRHNWLDVPGDGTANNVDVVVTETYDYAGVQGRVSSRSTTTTWPNDFEFLQTVTYDPLGRAQDVGYPACQGSPDCPTDALTVRNSYGADYLTEIGTPADSAAFATVTYHPNGLWAQIQHANTITTAQTNDPNGMRRPRRITVTGVLEEGIPFDTGLYAYDGAGNVKAMGADSFTYDALSRLDTATVHDGYFQDFTYDPYGNLTQVDTTPPGGSPTTDLFPVTAATNRLTDASYDGSGNVTLLDGVTHVYDPMNLAILRNPGPDAADWAAAYTADDERLIVWDTRKGTPQETWTLRGLDGKVLREYFYGSDITGELIFADGFENNDNGDHLCAWTRYDGTTPTCQGSLPGEPTWSIRHSYVYRGDALLADSSQGIAQHFHLDHLGSVRQVSSDGAVVVRSHDYLPYGAEVPGSSGSGLRFTGHERDGHGVGGGDDLDYMHARYCSPRMGRFLSVDPAMQTRRAARLPQLWNRYAYALSNPLSYLDQDGRDVSFVGVDEERRKELLLSLTRKTGLALTVGKDDKLIVLGVMFSASGEALGSSTARNDLFQAIGSERTLITQNLDGNPNLFMGKRSGALVRLDFRDFESIDFGENPTETLDPGMVFLHEMSHWLGRKDPDRRVLEFNPELMGETVRHMNRIREQLGLPLRLRYIAVRSRDRYEIPFTGGPISFPQDPNQ